MNLLDLIATTGLGSSIMIAIALAGIMFMFANNNSGEQ